MFGDHALGAALHLSKRERAALRKAEEIIDNARQLLLDTYGEDVRDGLECDTEWAMASIGIENLLDAGNMGSGGLLPVIYQAKAAR